MRDQLIDLGHSRQLAYTDIGDAGWPSVFFFHGAPSSRLRITYLEPEFLSRRIRVISPDRPSYGRSTPQPGRTMMDWPTDVSALADYLGIARFIVAGHSSGGPYALACAAALPQRVSACITLGGVTDFGWQPAWDGYPEVEADVMRAPDEETASALCEVLFGADGSRFMAAFNVDLSEADLRLYRDAVVAEQLRSARVEAFRQGVAGYAQDVYIQGRAWPFDASTITVPIVVAHGDVDTLLPLSHSRHTAEIIPGAVFRNFPDHGHFSILGELPMISASLTEAH